MHTAGGCVAPVNGALPFDASVVCAQVMRDGSCRIVDFYDETSSLAHAKLAHTSTDNARVASSRRPVAIPMHCQQDK